MTTRIRCISVRIASFWLLVALVAMALGACAQDASTRIATASESQTTVQATTNQAPTDEQDAALEYARCIRANGYPEWPDPNADGQFMIRRDAGMSFNDPRRVAAMEACQDLRPPGFAGGGVGDPAEQMEMLLELARCMRENGVPEFPDPVGGGRFVVGPGQGGFDPNSPRFQAALQACGAQMQGMMRGTAQ